MAATTWLIEISGIYGCNDLNAPWSRDLRLWATQAFISLKDKPKYLGINLFVTFFRSQTELIKHVLHQAAQVGLIRKNSYAAFS